MDLGAWLRSLGLERYEAAFLENEIDGTILPSLTAEDLRDIGVGPVGHRRKLLNAIAALRMDDSAKAASANKSSSSNTSSLSAEDRAERRQVTVMFSDLVGSTALSTRMDPEDLREVIGVYQAASAKVIQSFDGFVAKFMGDGILAYYGYPRAHEDDAERAVRAGVDIIRAVSALKTQSPEPLQVRIGIATGLVVIGDLIGSGEAQERGVVGETPNLAARLQSLATPNSVVIGPTTRRILRDLFEYQDLGRIEVKGFDAPVQAYRVIRASLVESRFEALRTTTTPLVGREEEIELLMRRWQRAKEHESSVVVVCGEPGIGKSRLAQAVQDRLSTEPHTRIRYFCSPHHEDSPLYPIIVQLERAAGFRREDTSEQRLGKLETVLGEGTKDIGEAAPLLAELLSIPTGERYPRLDLTPQKRKEKTLKALLAQVEGLSAKQPVLMVFEDAHWIDPTTREFLDLIIDRVPILRVLLIITYRPEFIAPWVGRPHVTSLTLNRLPLRERADMIRGVIGRKALPKEIAEQIIERTDGIPLFIEELTKAVIETGVVAETDDHYQITAPLAPLAIPTSLHASLLARLDRLAPVREMAQIAAALGRSFSHELISAVAQIPQQQLDHALDQLVTAELIFRRGTPPDAEYTFKHAMVQDTAYSTLLRGRRQQIHAKITTTLEKSFPETAANQPALLAHHCTEARLIEKAVAYLLKAGRQSVGRSAMTEAVAQLEKGLALLKALPDGVARWQQELDLQVALGQALVAAKGLAAPEVGNALARARQLLCEELNEPTQLGLIQYGQWFFHLVRGELDRAEHCAEELRGFGKGQTDPMLKYVGLVATGCSYGWLGKFTESRGDLENSLVLWDPAYRSVAWWPVDLFVSSLLLLSRGLLCLGYIDQASRRREEALAEARRLSPYNLAYALALTLYSDWAIGGPIFSVLQSTDELLAISSEQGFPGYIEVGNVMRAWCRGTMGYETESIPVLLEEVSRRQARRAAVLLPVYLMMLGEVLGIAGQPKEGLEQLGEALKLIEITRECWAETEIHRLRGGLLLRMNQHSAAEESYHQALEIARSQSAKFWELHAATSLARLWRDQGKRTEARDLLSPVYEWFTEGFDTPVLKGVRALLAELA
jgi:class 3 adenylate cyclase/tetratricopeptide (TPR) repeat protein